MIMDYLEDVIPAKIAPGVWKLCDPDHMEAERVVVIEEDRKDKEEK